MASNGITYTVPAKLTTEYLEKFWRAPGWMAPFILRSFQWRAAKHLIDAGYRDYEIAFGDTFSTQSRERQSRARITGSLPSGCFYLQVTAEISDEILSRRRAWRKYIPYQWYRRIPWRMIDPDGPHKWFEYLNPKRWQRIPRIDWEN